MKSQNVNTFLIICSIFWWFQIFYLCFLGSY
uniref:7TM_GPCR_Srx domain-containing protein n=1 Tax=Heterorhabditis bacteriophora TaxID=37862 RepID=A0A1I7WY25_HETBA